MTDQKAPEYRESDVRAGPGRVSKERARAGVTGHNVRYVLAFSTIAVVAAFSIIFVVFIHH
jgi:hypothetical protein